MQRDMNLGLQWEVRIRLDISSIEQKRASSEILKSTYLTRLRAGFNQAKITLTWPSILSGSSILISIIFYAFP